VEKKCWGADAGKETIVKLLIALVALLGTAGIALAADRVRIIVETDAGGDPDDEQSMVRFLLYANDFDVEGIIANRPKAIDGENKNSERTGLGIVRRMVRAYGECWPNLSKNDRRYPSEEYLQKRTMAGYDDVEDGVRLVMEAVDREDPRPVWFCNWGTNQGSGESSLKRALERVLKERGQERYTQFKNKIRLSSDDQFGDHVRKIEPPFVIWVDTFRPEIERRRWYWQFSAITAKTGGFDIRRDCLEGHGPLGALYPLNTTHPQKEGDTMSFLYLAPTGMNDPDRPEWGSWAGRYGKRDNEVARNYWWANVEDEWEGTKHRENSLKRWAEHLQNDFRARLDWCVKDYAQANHPPVVKVGGGTEKRVRGGETVTLDAGESRDPDGQGLKFRWIFYSEAGTYRGEMPKINWADEAVAWFITPRVDEARTLHAIVIATDGGEPALTRYQRVVVQVLPNN
jgi:hypothetical protein